MKNNFVHYKHSAHRKYSKFLKNTVSEIVQLFLNICDSLGKLGKIAIYARTIILTPRTTKKDK